MILRQLRVQVNDTPASLAMLLIIDREYWSLLAPQLTSDQLLAANDHLGRSGLKQLFPIDSAIGANCFGERLSVDGPFGLPPTM